MVLGRKAKKKQVNAQVERPKGKTRSGSKEKEDKETRTKKKKPLRALERRLSRGAGVIIELQGGRSADYEEVMKRCEKKISLKDIGIPPPGIRRIRGGILLEVKCDGKEEKAERLASRIRDVVKSMDGSKV